MVQAQAAPGARLHWECLQRSRRLRVVVVVLGMSLCCLRRLLVAVEGARAGQVQQHRRRQRRKRRRAHERQRPPLWPGSSLRCGSELGGSELGCRRAGSAAAAPSPKSSPSSGFCSGSASAASETASAAAIWTSEIASGAGPASRKRGACSDSVGLRLLAAASWDSSS